MITELLIEMQDNHNNTFDDSAYEQFVAETQSELPSGEPAILCDWCGKATPEADVVSYTANKKKDEKAELICKKCHATRFMLSETVAGWKKQLDNY